MSDEGDQTLLAEVRQLQRLGRKIFYLLIFLLVATLFTISIPTHMPTQSSWSEVRCLIDRQEFKRAFAIAERLVAQAPRYHYGHAVLGQLFLAVNDIKNAEIQYSMAYDLFPSREAEETLQALRKRLAAEAAPK